MTKLSAMKGFPLSRVLIYGVFLLIAGSYALRGFRTDTTLDVGDRIPAFKATLSNGQPLDLRKAPGRVLLLTFWASWCDPCRREAPMLNSLQDRALVVGISLDDADADAAAALARGIGIRFPVVGARPDLPQRFDVQSLPTTYVVAADGTIVFAKAGIASQTELEQAIAKAGARGI